SLAPWSVTAGSTSASPPPSVCVGSGVRFAPATVTALVACTRHTRLGVSDARDGAGSVSACVQPAAIVAATTSARVTRSRRIAELEVQCAAGDDVGEADSLADGA